MNLEEVLNFRRSVRKYITDKDLDTEKVKHCIELATLAPSSSNMQLWEFHHITDRKMIPFLYARFFGLLGLFRKLLTLAVSVFRPIFTFSSEADQRVVIHKSCALAAQTFMIAMANEGYDTCPLEGFDSQRVKKLLNLPHAAEINMIVSCGFRDGNKGIWGQRFRVPFEQVYKH